MQQAKNKLAVLNKLPFVSCLCCGVKIKKGFNCLKPFTVLVEAHGFEPRTLCL